VPEGGLAFLQISKATPSYASSLFVSSDCYDKSACRSNCPENGFSATWILQKPELAEADFAGAAEDHF
jgi:hypothetical protein